MAAEFILRGQGASLRDRTNDLLCSVILLERERRPVIIVIENVHWFDASSEELLCSLAARVLNYRVMLARTTRTGPVDTVLSQGRERMPLLEWPEETLYDRDVRFRRGDKVRRRFKER